MRKELSCVRNSQHGGKGGSSRLHARGRTTTFSVEEASRLGMGGGRRRQAPKIVFANFCLRQCALCEPSRWSGCVAQTRPYHRASALSSRSRSPVSGAGQCQPKFGARAAQRNTIHPPAGHTKKPATQPRRYHGQTARLRPTISHPHRPQLSTVYMKHRSGKP